METTVDCKYGIIIGVDVYPANEKENLLVLKHLERQIQNGVPMQNIALDRGYDTGVVHRGLELLGITGYIPAIQFCNSPEKYGFYYLPQEDAFCCPEGARLVYKRLNCSQTTGKYLRCYQVQVILVSTVRETLPVLNKQTIGAGSWEAVVILPFIEGSNVLAVINIGT